MPKSPKKTGKVREEVKERSGLNKVSLAFSLILAVAIVSGALLYHLSLPRESGVKFSLKAIVVDQLSGDIQNQTFVDSVVKILSENGFSVTYHDYKETNVLFFRNLAKASYGIIILRLHSALRKDKPIVDFFTSEPYDPRKYVKEQEEGLLVKGTVSHSDKSYFAFTPKFVENLEGAFPRSIVFAMGCQSLNQTAGISMAEAFHRKGAAVYIGWTSWVTAPHSDAETVKLLKKLLCENMTVHEAVASTAKEYHYGASLAYYPASAKNLKMRDLKAEAEVKSSGITQKAAYKTFMCERWYWTAVLALSPPRPEAGFGGSHLLDLPVSTFLSPRRGGGPPEHRLPTSQSPHGGGGTLKI